MPAMTTKTSRRTRPRPGDRGPSRLRAGIVSGGPRHLIKAVYVSLQAAMSFAFCAAGSGEALITSTHTSFAAARAPARLPAAALLQIPSTLLLVLAASVGSRAMISLQIAT